MYTEEQSIYFTDQNPFLKSVSISRLTVIKNDGVEVGRSAPITRAFMPGEIELVKEFIGLTESPEITYLESIWTPEVIQAYEQAKSEALGGNQEP